jgi:streptomycin 6-kinase
VRRAEVDLVLKVPYPARSSPWEGAVLRWRDGRGTVRLVAEDPATGGLLLERCVPGTSAEALPAPAALDVVLAAAARGRVAPPPWLPSVADQVATWREAAASGAPEGLPGEVRRHVDDALALGASLAGDAVAPRVVDADLHAGNVLRARRAPWLAIDPKPLAGDPAFGLAPAVALGWAVGGGDGALARAADRLGVDARRVRAWCGVEAAVRAVEGRRLAPRWLALSRWCLDGAQAREPD